MHNKMSWYDNLQASILILLPFLLHMKYVGDLVIVINFSSYQNIIIIQLFQIDPLNSRKILSRYILNHNRNYRNCVYFLQIINKCVRNFCKTEIHMQTQECHLSKPNLTVNVCLFNLMFKHSKLFLVNWKRNFNLLE